MKTRNKMMIAAAITAALGGAMLTGLSFAHDRGEGNRGDWRHDGERAGHHARRHDQHADDQEHFGHHRRGERGYHRSEHGLRGERLLQNFDSNNDGKLTQEEINQARVDRLKEFDSDNDGRLNLDEYAVLWLNTHHSRMVDQFQDLDDDGDAAVTAEEFQAPFAQLAGRLDRNNDGEISSDELRSR